MIVDEDALPCDHGWALLDDGSGPFILAVKASALAALTVADVWSALQLFV